MKYKIFVDGQEGTTGLKIQERLSGRTDLDILVIDAEKRKDSVSRKILLNAADVVFLCLPDDAAREAVVLIDNPDVRVIDASTAHRTDPNWAYGLPELSYEHRSRIAHSTRVAVTGCHAAGFIASLYPLVALGVVPDDYPISAFSLTGYTGGGKKMIAQYEDPARDESLKSPRIYALPLKHKHVPEMQYVTGLKYPPSFSPIVADIPQGMVVSIPLSSRFLPGKPTPADIHAILSRHYQGATFVKVAAFDPELKTESGYMQIMTNNDTNLLEIFVFGNDQQITVSARLDNLGKGASGAAVQCMNIMLGLDEGTGLD